MPAWETSSLLESRNNQPCSHVLTLVCSVINPIVTPLGQTDILTKPETGLIALQVSISHFA